MDLLFVAIIVRAIVEAIMTRSQSTWKRLLLASTVVMLGATVCSGSALAQTAFNRGQGGGGGGGGGGGDPPSAVDPGVRGGPAGAGGPLAGLSAAQLAFFNASETNRFEEVDTVPSGLGPFFNLNSCSGCHAQPAVGGSSPATNPEVAVATLDGAQNVVPSFVTANGPVREARFVRNPNGTPDGSVHELFVITGRSDASGCNVQQFNFAAEQAQNNVIFRIPTPLFGLGLVENTSDLSLETAFNNAQQQKSSLGISGAFNIDGANVQTISRFGWKAQNPSLLVFSGEAYDVEIGVTNDAFPNKRFTPPTNCLFNPLPEDTTNLTDNTNSGSPAADFSSDVVDFAAFMRMTAPPTPAVSGTTSTSSTSTSLTATTQLVSADPSSVLSAAAGTTSSTSTTSASSTSISSTAFQQGEQIFQNVGCNACHIINQTTGNSELGTPATNVTFQPFSDFAVHDMGTGLADGVSQGTADGSQFRSAPLWGVGQRIFFLHDGRTNNIVTAIEDHASSGSEANTVIHNFNMLSQTDQQALVNFLRAL
jgi:mono/diheme cytochrome c family protein